MNERRAASVSGTILTLLFFLPEFVFFLLAAANYSFWYRLYSRRKLNVRLYHYQNRSAVWFLREQESLTEFLPLLGAKMPIKTSSKFESHRFVPADQVDLPAADQTVFIFRDLKHSEAVDVGDNIFGIGDEGEVDRLKAQTLQLKMVLKRLVSWENLLDENGQQIRFPDNRRRLAEIMDDLANGAPEVMAEMQRAFGSPTGKGRS
jgi:hypothetical protein